MSLTMNSSIKEDSESLLQKLREREEELFQAGKYGKSLLETNAHLESMLHQMNDDYEKKLQDLEQQKFSLEVKVEELKNAANQENIASAQEKQSLVLKHRCEIDTLEKQNKTAISQINLEAANLQTELDESTLIKQQLQEKIEKQQSTVAELRSALQKQSLPKDSDSSQVKELSKENARLQESCNSLLEQIYDLQHLVEQLNLRTEELQKSNDYLVEVKQDVENELKACSKALELSQLTNQDLRNEIEEIHSHPQDPFSKGNSLFAEVEDRRVQAERRLISVQVKLNCFEKKYQLQLNYSMKLKAQIAQLLQSGGRDADRERISRLEQALTSSQDDSKHLIDKVTDLEAKLGSKSLKCMNDKRQNESSQDFADFLEDLLKKKDAELKNLSADLQKCHVDLLSESRRANEADLDVYAAQSERDRLKSRCIKLQMEVTRLKEKCGEEGKRGVKPGKVEKIPLEPLSVSSQSANNENIENNPNKTTCSDNALNSTASGTVLKNEKTASCDENSVQQKSSLSALKDAPQECRQQ